MIWSERYSQHLLLTVKKTTATMTTKTQDFANMLFVMGGGT
jgi:hypothetical protein